jgi:hypothetical protein
MVFLMTEMATELVDLPVITPPEKIVIDELPQLRPLKKVVYTLNIGNYAPEICALTYPLIDHWAKKIGAHFHVIKERKFPLWPIVYEKLQIHELARRHQVDWAIYLDSDALVHPDFFDPTDHLSKDTVCHNGSDMANIRWKYDQYFRRDGRHIGSCNWCTMASDWCLDLWRPLDDLTPAEAEQRISPTMGERLSGLIPASHLIDDYTLSRNIARFGLKFTTLIRMCESVGMPHGNFFLWHKYTIPNHQKIQEMLQILTAKERQGIDGVGFGWQLMSPNEAVAFKKQWNLA